MAMKVRTLNRNADKASVLFGLVWQGYVGPIAEIGNNRRKEALIIDPDGKLMHGDGSDSGFKLIQGHPFEIRFEVDRRDGLASIYVNNIPGRGRVIEIGPLLYAGSFGELIAVEGSKKARASALNYQKREN